MKLFLALVKTYGLPLVVFLGLLLPSAVVLAHEPNMGSSNVLNMMSTHETEVLVVINGDSITTIDLTELLIESHKTIPAEQRADYDYNLLVTKLINDCLIIQEATAMGMDQEEMVAKPVENIRLSEAVNTFVSAAYQPKAEITDEMILRRLEKNYKRAQFRTIAVSTKEEADQVYKAIMAGVSMDSLARENSFDSQAKEGGLHKAKYWKDILVPLREEAVKLAVNDVSQPFKFEEAYMILKLEQLETADPEILGHAESIIHKSLVLDQRKQAWEKLMDSLATLYPIVINHETLDRIKADSGVLLSGSFTIESDAPVLSIAGQTPINEASFRKKLSHKAMSAAKEGFAEQVKITIDELSENYLLEAAAILNGYLEYPNVISKASRIKDSLLIEKYLQENIVSQIVYEDENLKTIYDENQDWWYVSGDVKLGVMLCADKNEAEQALAMLRDGANFDYVNSRHGIENDYGTRENDWREAKSLPEELAEQIKSLPIGSFAEGIYQLSDGFGIFRLTARKEAKQRTFEEVMPNLRNIYFQREFNSLMDQLMETLKENSTIDLYEDRIAKFLEG